MHCLLLKVLNCWALDQGQGVFHCCSLHYLKDIPLTCLFMKTNTSLFFQRVKQAAMSVHCLGCLEWRTFEASWGWLMFCLLKRCRFFTISFALLNTTGYTSPVSHWALCICMCMFYADASVAPLARNSWCEFCLSVVI